MGLDMMTFVRKGEAPNTPVDFWVSDDDPELWYWRKHPNLHGWMEALYRVKGGAGPDFNGNTLLLTAADLDALERAINSDALPHTTGFFFGASDGSEKDDDLRFVAAARAEIAAGNHVYYTSSW